MMSKMQALGILELQFWAAADDSAFKECEQKAGEQLDVLIEIYGPQVCNFREH